MVSQLRKITLSVGLLLTATSLSAQDMPVRRGNCLPDVAADDVAAARGQAPRRLPAINRDWNPNKIYKQAVILVTYSGTNDTTLQPCNFSREDPLADYKRIFNEPGYNERQGAGCVADYFRDQSAGMLNIEFDVFGPYQVSSKAQPYENPTESTHNYGRDVLREAANMWIAENPSLDYSQYDWNGNGRMNQLIFVCAGYSGNQGNEKCFGYIWPNTSTFSTITTPSGTTIADYTASAELWANDTSCGIGTICHEFTHSLGLPDIYPTNSWTYSAVDEWDLMDGGNFTNFGWCPPNWSPLEKMLLGWLTPTELTAAETVSDLKPLAEGGTVYQVKHTDTEYLLLENRQWNGWDAGLPGQGLVIYHVNYVASAWSGNTPNNTSNAPNYYLVPADNMSYDDWNTYMVNNGFKSQYQQGGRMHNWHLSGSVYPLVTETEGVLNNELTDASTPAARMYNANGEGSTLLGKPITGIEMTANGLVSFKFMGGSGTDGIKDLPALRTSGSMVCDMQGRRVEPSTLRPGLYIVNGKKLILK